MDVRVEVALKAGGFDARGSEVVHQAATLGLTVGEVRVRDLFFLGGVRLDAEELQRVIAALLVDPVVADARVSPLREATALPPGWRAIEVVPRPGVTDSPAESLLEAARSIGVTSLQRAATGRRYEIAGVDEAGLRRLAAGVLANEVVETWTVDEAVAPPFVEVEAPDRTVDVIDLRPLDDAGLVALSRERRLSLDVIEMRAIQAIFVAEGRAPTDAELEMFAQTWSEHCVHKTFKARIELVEDGVHSVVDSMFRTFIAAATEASTSGWLKSVFVDNAGIVGFEEGWDLAFKVETHNHPSALEPFGGANTGVGGVIRDVLGVSARPIACTDVLCFGPPDLPFGDLPAGVLHPRRIASGVVAGIGDYGNKMGIPTVNGSVIYGRGYTANPLVYCGCLGLLPVGKHRRGAHAGDLVVVIGGRTGRDGLRGATFSSMEMDTSTHQVAGSSVQIGHAIHEKQAMEAMLQARDEGRFRALTDCGAGGLSSAIGEMAEHLGAEIFLERVPLKYPGLRPWEIWLSEAQERMVLAVPPADWERFQEICAGWGTDCTALGTFTGSGRLVLRCEGVAVADLAMDALHEGIPQRQLKAEWSTPAHAEPSLSGLDAGAELLALLATPDIRSKEDIVRGYDHEVQAGTVVKPFVGASQQGPSDAAVLRPLEVVLATGRAEGRGVALSVAIRPSYGAIDPELMAWAVIDEAIRNVVAVGADPDQVALLDNFCWGNPNLPDRLGGLVRCARGCRDAAMAFGAPYISGKDSLNNEYTGSDGLKHAIPGTLLISALAIVPDITRTITMDLKAAGDALYVIGLTSDECGGSAWYELHGQVGAHAPRVPDGARETMRAVHRAIAGGLVVAAHDCSEGGLGVALAEMALAGELGADVSLAEVPWVGPARSDLRVLFSESTTRFIVEVRPEARAAFEAAMAGQACARFGQVSAEPVLRVSGEAGELLRQPVERLAAAWRGHLGG